MMSQMSEHAANSSPKNSDHMLRRIEAMLDEFPRGENRFAKWVLKFPDEAANLSIQELAKKSGTSEPTIVRFAKRFKCKGLRDFKIKLSEFLASQTKKSLQEKKITADPFLASQALLNQVLNQLQQRVLQSVPSHELKNFLKKLSETKHILILADPELKTLGELAFNLLVPFCKNLMISTQTEQYQGLVQRLSRTDIIFVLQKKSFETLKALQLAKQRKIFIAAFGQLPLEPPIDLFFGASDSPDHLELSILLALTQITTLLPAYIPEARGIADLFHTVEVDRDPLKKLQGELW
jgi:DNA-binding MurR/RpiR family transcriptional regulator